MPNSSNPLQFPRIHREIPFPGGTLVIIFSEGFQTRGYRIGFTKAVWWSDDFQWSLTCESIPICSMYDWLVVWNIFYFPISWE